MLAIFYCPMSCNGKYREKMAKVIGEIGNAGIEYEYCELTDDTADADIAKLSEGKECIVIGGGDGTVNRVINATYRLDIPFVLLPFGSGNDFARTYVGSKYRGDILKTLSEGKEELADLWELNGDRVFVQSMVLGLSIKTMEVKVEMQSNGYVGPILKTLKIYEPMPFHIETAEKSVDDKFLIVALENSPSSCGGLKFSEHSKTDDGYLEVISCPYIKKKRAYLNLVACIRGWLNRQPNVEIIKTKQVRVTGEGTMKFTVDGETHTGDVIDVRLSDRRIRIRHL